MFVSCNPFFILNVCFLSATVQEAAQGTALDEAGEGLRELLKTG